MLLNATLWFTVTHTFQGNETEFADRSKRICITLQSCFCRSLAWNWEVSTGRSLNSFFVFSQVAQHSVISSYIEILNKIFWLEKLPCVCLHDILKRLLAKICLLASFMCLTEFVAVCVTLNDSCI